MKYSKEFLHTLFEYKDGVLFRRIARSNRVKAGQKASGLNNKGYLYTSINGQNFFGTPNYLGYALRLRTSLH